jgi:hypothetical protein
MVVGSLLVMAVQTVTAYPCSSISNTTNPTLAVLCGDQSLYTGSKLTMALNTACTNDPCSGNDAAKCCEPKANCDAGVTLGTSPSLTEVCGGDDAFTGTLIAGAKCAGAKCGLVDKSTCCVQKAACGTITADSSPSLATVCGDDPGYTGALGSSSAKCAGATCGVGDRATCCATPPKTPPAGGDDNDGVNDDDAPVTCSVTDGSKASPWMGGTSFAEECTCTGVAKICTTLNVCDVAKKTCVCTPGKDHWCFEDAERIYAVKFGCFKDGDNKFKGLKCDGDNVLQQIFSDATCATHTTPANDGEDTTYSVTKTTSVKKKDDGTLETKEDTTATGISTCKGGVAGAGAGAAAPGPAPGPAGDAEFDAGSVAQCSTLAMLMVVAAMWAGRN